MTDIWDTYLSSIQRVIDDLSGNQEEISKISKRWRTLATNLTTETGALKRAVKSVNDAWNGDSAEAFADHMAKYPASGTSLSTALTNCAGKLDTAGTELATAKGEVQALYREKRAWLDEQRNDPDTTTISMTSIRSQVNDALERAKGPKGRASDAVKQATDEINKHLGDVRFFTGITAPGDQDFVPAKGKGWVPDPDFQPKGTTQLASYDGNGAPPGGNASNGAPPGGNGGGGGGGGKPSLAVPPNAHSLAPNPRAQAVVDYALKQLGDRYVWGATGPDTFDCSGLTLRAYESAGTNIPRVAQDQWLRGPRIPDGKAQAGDLIFFDNNGDGTADHVGIVLDPEKQTMIHAPNSRSVVRIESYATYPGRLGMTRPGMG